MPQDDPSNEQARHLQLGAVDLPGPERETEEKRGAVASTYAAVDRPATSEELREAASDAVERFRAFSAEHGYTLADEVALTGLASALGSQLVLLAGPSGRGKSVLASMLGAFLAPARREIMEGRRQLLGPEDVVGFYSPLTTNYAPGPNLSIVQRLAAQSEADPSPVLIIDEINLSTIEGYLAPIVHGFSSPASAAVEWSLVDEVVAGADLPNVPGSNGVLNLGPFLRVLGTINVDETAHAPSRKVASRACVMLVDDPPEQDLAKDIDRVFVGAPSSGTGLGDPSLLGDPRVARGALTPGERERLVIALQDVVSSYLAPAGCDAVSHRQLEQFASFASWHVLLGRDAAQLDEADMAACTAAAEAWLVQFVLPSLPADALGRVVELIASSQAEDEEISDSPEAPAGRMVRTARSLQDRAGGLGLLGQPVDFWDRLS